jgi:YD repeat-containing protein
LLTTAAGRFFEAAWPTVASYAYDAQGRRKSKTVGAVATVYVTDADNREVLAGR